MAGHILSVFLSKEVPSFPYIALIASGGHSSIFIVNDPFSYDVLGRTRDDAAGEAFDKVSKLLGLGYPGGPIISNISSQGNPAAIPFPRSWLDPGSLDFSFSGLKTSVVNYVHKLQQTNEIVPVEDICASFQEAVIEVLAEKAILAARQKDAEQLVLAGGVAANPRLRFFLKERCNQEGLQLFMPPVDFCTDNAAMIALVGTYLLQKGERANLASDVYSRISVPPLKC
jgi:N6-L-threonylcarbamoyladenine synthase